MKSHQSIVQVQLPSGSSVEFLAEVDLQSVAVVDVRAMERSAGWKIIAVEEGTDGWTLDSMPLRMMIDRIERHESTGHYRVMDFKTSASAKKPRDVHFTKYNAGSTDGVVVAYANLPRAVRDTKIESWEISEVEMASFRQWLTAAVTGVRAGRFWPPGELDWSQRNYDEFGSLAPDGFEEALTPEFIGHVKER